MRKFEIISGFCIWKCNTPLLRYSFSKRVDRKIILIAGREGVDYIKVKLKYNTELVTLIS